MIWQVTMIWTQIRLRRSTRSYSQKPLNSSNELTNSNVRKSSHCMISSWVTRISELLVQTKLFQTEKLIKRWWCLKKSSSNLVKISYSKQDRMKRIYCLKSSWVESTKRNKLKHKLYEIRLLKASWKSWITRTCSMRVYMIWRRRLTLTTCEHKGSTRLKILERLTY